MTLLVAVPLLAVASLALAEMPAVGVVGTWNVTMVQSADASCPVGKEGAATDTYLKLARLLSQRPICCLPKLSALFALRLATAHLLARV